MARIVREIARGVKDESGSECQRQKLAGIRCFILSFSLALSRSLSLSSRIPVWINAMEGLMKKRKTSRPKA